MQDRRATKQVNKPRNVMGWPMLVARAIAGRHGRAVRHRAATYATNRVSSRPWVRRPRLRQAGWQGRRSGQALGVPARAAVRRGGRHRLRARPDPALVAVAVYGGMAVQIQPGRGGRKYPAHRYRTGLPAWGRYRLALAAYVAQAAAPWVGATWRLSRPAADPPMARWRPFRFAPQVCGGCGVRVAPALPCLRPAPAPAPA